MGTPGRRRSRRRFVQGVGTLTVVATAGCLGAPSRPGHGDPVEGIDPALELPPSPPAATFTFGILSGSGTIYVRIREAAGPLSADALHLTGQRFARPFTDAVLQDRSGPLPIESGQSLRAGESVRMEELSWAPGTDVHVAWITREGEEILATTTVTGGTDSGP